ncbi:MAG: NAD(P)-binding domain-containing protein [Anaerolineae bacterium]|nr:NAD(P)-binding domain-containing protein [Anaerolineae bacterium]
MREVVNTVIIGGGQAGLALSYCLTQRGHEHVVLEQATQAGYAWRHQRWESFTLVTPNKTLRLPGAEYAGLSPEGFLPRDEIVTYFEEYVDRCHLPVQYGTRVTSVEPGAPNDHFLVKTNRRTFAARQVVVATGSFQRPKRPSFATHLTPDVHQLHSSEYRRADALPPGAVLVVGSAQSGSQIAEELYQSGRPVYLCVGSAGRAPRRYRGKDIFEWLDLSGFLSMTVDQLPSRQARFAGNPHVSGKAGGHVLNLHQFARDGVRLLGHIQGAEGDRVSIAPDLKENLAKGDKFETDIVRLVDNYIARMGLEAPPETLPQLTDGYTLADVTDLNVKAAGITSLIWATGYSWDFSWVKAAVLDEIGYPITQRGVTSVAGLYFLGLHWLYSRESALLCGVGKDADYLAETITNRSR